MNCPSHIVMPLLYSFCASFGHRLLIIIVIVIVIRDLPEISREGGGRGGGDVKLSVKNDVTLASDGNEISRPSLWAWPKLP